MTTELQPAIEGWFSVSEEPALRGQCCDQCGTFVFPPVATICPNPSCSSREFASVALSRTGKVWSYTDARYEPPPPYVSTTSPFEPFAIVAVELEAEKMIVLGQVASGFDTRDLSIGSSVELVLETLEVREDIEYLVWKWRPVVQNARS